MCAHGERLIFFTSDLHLNHANILRYDGRPFPSIKVHDQHIVSTWNNVVCPQSVVYLLGDLGFHDQQYLVDTLKQLNGHKHLVRGNHDRKLNNKVLDIFETVHEYLEIKIVDNELPAKHQQIILCHYPLESWRAAHHGTWHLHGHTHNDLLIKRRGRLNVGLHLHDYKPWSYAQVKALLGAEVWGTDYQI